MIVILPIVVTVEGIITDIKPVASNAFIPIDVTVVGIIIVVKGQPVYMKALILVVPAGIVTDDITVIVYRFIPGTVYVVSFSNDDDYDEIMIMTR